MHSIDFAQLVDSIKVNIVWKDLQSHYLGANRHFLELLDLTPETIIGKTDYDLTTADLAKKIIENDQKVFRTGETHSFHEHVINKLGEPKVYLSYKTPLFDQNNELFGLTTLAIDVTEVNKKEALLSTEAQAKSTYIDSMVYFDQIATILNQMASKLPVNIYWEDAKGVYLGCNDRFTKILNLRGVDNIVGKKIFDIFPYDLAEKIWAVDQQVMKRGESITLEETGPDVKGELATYLSGKAPVRNDKAEVVGMLGISLDITKQKQLEQNLRIAKERAETADRAKSEFIMNISHDIRTPFMGILGFSELLEAQEDNAFKKETLGYIRQSAQRLLAWMNEIIEVVVSSGQTEEVDQPIDLKSLLEDLSELMSARVELKKLKWTVNIDPEVPEHLIGDLAGLRRILLNLVGNAVKFTDEGSVSVEVKLVSRSDSSASVDFIVSDTGIGIPKDKFEDIFKKFSRLTSSYSGKYPGSGLGLFNVSEIVSRMGGTVKIDSTLGKGSVFSCQLPLKVAPKVGV